MCSSYANVGVRARSGSTDKLRGDGRVDRRPVDDPGTMGRTSGPLDAGEVNRVEPALAVLSGEIIKAFANPSRGMDPPLRIDRAAVEETHALLVDREPTVVALINRVRDALGESFDTEVAAVDGPAYRSALAAVFADDDLAINVAGLAQLLVAVDVADDYPGFVVDEVLGRELAGTIAGGQPWRTLAESTYHFADTMHGGAAGEAAGMDDLEAAVAAGVQTRLPGWPWTADGGPFDGDSETP